MTPRLRVFALAAAVALSLVGCNPLDPFRVMDEEQPIDTVKVAPSQQSVAVGDTVRFNATMSGAGNTAITGRPVHWSVGNPLLASVDSSGLVTGLAKGTTEIIATSQFHRGSAILTVVATTP